MPLAAPGAAVDVTIVVPVWGAHVAYLREAVETLVAQEGPRFRVVVVDNCSEPPVESPQPGVEVVRTSRRELVGAARNRGLQEADSPYVLFWDADDHLLPGGLELMWRTLEARPDAVACTSVSLTWTPESGPGEPWPWPRDPYYRLSTRPRAFALLSLLVNTYTTTGPALMRTAAVRDAGGFAEDITFYEDWALALSLTVRGRILMRRDPTRLYRVHPDSLSSGHLDHPDAAQWLRGLRRRARRDPRTPAWLKALLPLVAALHAVRTRRPKGEAAGGGYYTSTLGADAAAATVEADPARADRPAAAH